MILALDVGNTNICIAIFDKNVVKNIGRICTKDIKISDQFGVNILNLLKHNLYQLKNFTHIIVSSVVPTINDIIKESLEKYLNLNVIFARVDMKNNITINRKNPKTIGIDRFLNALYVYNTINSAAIIVDYGTANTYDLIDKNGVIVTGCITPGFEIISNYCLIYENIDFEFANICSILGETKYIIEKLKSFSKDDKISLIATGGICHKFEEFDDIFDHVDDLITIKGMQTLYYLNF